jgi:hypothetical protein
MNYIIITNPHVDIRVVREWCDENCIEDYHIDDYPEGVAEDWTLPIILSCSDDTDLALARLIFG